MPRIVMLISAVNVYYTVINFNSPSVT